MELLYKCDTGHIKWNTHRTRNESVNQKVMVRVYTFHPVRLWHLKINPDYPQSETAYQRSTSGFDGPSLDILRIVWHFGSRRFGSEATGKRSGARSPNSNSRPKWPISFQDDLNHNFMQSQERPKKVRFQPLLRTKIKKSLKCIINLKMLSASIFI